MCFAKWRLNSNAIKQRGIDAAVGAARRDEEKARAKEPRMAAAFGSLRRQQHVRVPAAGGAGRRRAKRASSPVCGAGIERSEPAAAEGGQQPVFGPAARSAG